jgi:hypothetical protein
VKLRDAGAMLNAGRDLAAVLQALEMSEATLVRWRAGHRREADSSLGSMTPAGFAAACAASASAKASAPAVHAAVCQGGTHP